MKLQVLAQNSYGKKFKTSNNLDKIDIYDKNYKKDMAQLQNVIKSTEISQKLEQNIQQMNVKK